MNRELPSRDEIQAHAHAPLREQVALLERIVRANPGLMTTLSTLSDDEWIGAGVVFQNVWNLMSGNPWNAHIKDVDVLYFDAEAIEDPEDERRRAARVDPAGLELDVVNVARIHTWYEGAFGRAIDPYTSVAESVATWPTVCSALAIRVRDDALDLIAPFGLHDTFLGRIRPNRAIIPRDVYEAKVARWTSAWPWLDAWGWDGAPLDPDERP